MATATATATTTTSRALAHVIGGSSKRKVPPKAVGLSAEGKRRVELILRSEKMKEAFYHSPKLARDALVTIFREDLGTDAEYVVSQIESYWNQYHEGLQATHATAPITELNARPAASNSVIQNLRPTVLTSTSNVNTTRPLPVIESVTAPTNALVAVSSSTSDDAEVPETLSSSVLAVISTDSAIDSAEGILEEARQQSIRNFQAITSRVERIVGTLSTVAVISDESPVDLVEIPPSILRTVIQHILQSSTDDLTKHMEILFMLLCIAGQMNRKGLDVARILGRLQHLSQFDSTDDEKAIIQIRAGKLYIDKQLVAFFNDEYFKKIFFQFVEPEFFKYIRNQDFFEQTIIMTMMYRTNLNRFVNMRSLVSQIVIRLAAYRNQLKRMKDLTSGGGGGGGGGGGDPGNNNGNNGNFYLNYMGDIGRFVDNLDEVFEMFESHPHNTENYSVYERLSTWNKIAYWGLGILQISSQFVTMYNETTSRIKQLELMKSRIAAERSKAENEFRRSRMEEETERTEALRAENAAARAAFRTSNAAEAVKAKRAEADVADKKAHVNAVEAAGERLASRAAASAAATAGAGNAIRFTEEVRGELSELEARFEAAILRQTQIPLHDDFAADIAESEGIRDKVRTERCFPTGKPLNFEKAGKDTVCKGMFGDIFHYFDKRHLDGGNEIAHTLLMEKGTAASAASSATDSALRNAKTAIDNLSNVVGGAGNSTRSGNLFPTPPEITVRLSLTIAIQAVTALERDIRVAEVASTNFEGALNVVEVVTEAIGPDTNRRILTEPFGKILAAHMEATKEEATRQTNLAVLSHIGRTAQTALSVAAGMFEPPPGSNKPNEPDGRPPIVAPSIRYRQRAPAGHRSTNKPVVPGVPSLVSAMGAKKGNIYKPVVSGGYRKVTRKKKNQIHKTRKNKQIKWRQYGGNEVNLEFNSTKHLSLNDRIKLLIISIEQFKTAMKEEFTHL